MEIIQKNSSRYPSKKYQESSSQKSNNIQNHVLFFNDQSIIFCSSDSIFFKLNSDLEI